VGSLSSQHGASSGCGWRNGLQLWRLAANILNWQTSSGLEPLDLPACTTEPQPLHSCMARNVIGRTVIHMYQEKGTFRHGDESSTVLGNVATPKHGYSRHERSNCMLEACCLTPCSLVCACTCSCAACTLSKLSQRYVMPRVNGRNESTALRTADGRSVCLDVEPALGLVTRFFFLSNFPFCLCGAPSLTRGPVCLL
jgi:hypothetical protein